MTDNLVTRLRELNTFEWHARPATTKETCFAAAARIEELEQALEYYAKNHYPNVDDGPWGVNSNDFGDVARAALEKTDD